MSTTTGGACGYKLAAWCLCWHCRDPLEPECNPIDLCISGKCFRENEPTSVKPHTAVDNQPAAPPLAISLPKLARYLMKISKSNSSDGKCKHSFKLWRDPKFVPDKLKLKEPLEGDNRPAYNFRPIPIQWILGVRKYLLRWILNWKIRRNNRKFY